VKLTVVNKKNNMAYITGKNYSWFSTEQFWLPHLSSRPGVLIRDNLWHAKENFILVGNSSRQWT